MEPKQKIQIMTDSYIRCAKWADKPEDSLEWDEEVSEIAKKMAFEDCQQLFLNIQLCQIGDVKYSSIDLSNQETLTQLGKDLWLTRNNHGMGFWDGKDNNEWSLDDGKRLTEYCHNNFGQLSLWINEDMQIEFEQG